MPDLIFTAFFTKNTGVPAEGLTLSEIDMYITRQEKSTMTETIVWDGTENPSDEIDNMGAYSRKLVGADPDLYNYYGRATYTGVTGLDQNDVTGAVTYDYPPLGTAQPRTYTVKEDGTLTPIEGVKVEVHRNAAGTDVYWVGWTDAAGVARDLYSNLPRLDPSPIKWYMFRFKGGYSFDNPDIEEFT